MKHTIAKTGPFSGFVGHLIGHAAATMVLEVVTHIEEHYARHTPCSDRTPATTVAPANAYALKRQMEAQLAPVIQKAIADGITSGISLGMGAMDDVRLAKASNHVPMNYDVALREFIMWMKNVNCDTPYKEGVTFLTRFLSLLVSTQDNSTIMKDLCTKYYQTLLELREHHPSVYRPHSSTRQCDNFMPDSTVEFYHAIAKQLADDLGLEDI